MINCRQATRLISQSMDARLPWHRRLVVKLHLLYCIWCRRYARQLKFLRNAAEKLPRETFTSSPSQLHPEAKDQIRARLKSALEEPPSDRG